MQKFFILFIGLLTLSSFIPTNKYGFYSIQNQIGTDTPKRAQTIQLLTKKWVSTAYIADSIEIPFTGGFTIHFKSDRSFTSFYKPDNHKKGDWFLSNDSTFVLSMKATDDFRIIELNDSILVAKTLWTTNNRTYIFKCQMHKK